MIQGMTVNLKGGAPGGIGKNVFYSIDRGLFELYDPKKHGSNSEIVSSGQIREKAPELSTRKKIEEAPIHVGTLLTENKTRIYITHCSYTKNNSLKDTGKKVTPDKLYTSKKIQSFMNTCNKKRANWAIFSDLYGIWFPNIEHEWYEKAPNSVTDREFRRLLNDFDQKLHIYDEIWFYYNPGRFHPSYERLLQETSLREKVERFTHIWQIA
jgi:hypothetical protein